MMIATEEIVYEMMFRAMKKAGMELPADVYSALAHVAEHEDIPLARLHMTTTLENLEAAKADERLACADTGFPLFYVRIGSNVELKPGLWVLRRAAGRAVADLTADARLRPTMVHPLKRTNRGDNLGDGIPLVEIHFCEDFDGLEIIAVPKGGGSEIFGTFYRMLVPADGKRGVIKFVLDCAYEAAYAGKVCPPCVIGVGIGGTADLCMRMAKEAAILRPIGSRNPDPEIAALENDLMDAVNKLGIGPMGSPGKTLALDVHVECDVTHTAALPVAFNAQCSICRRAAARLNENGTIDIVDQYRWFRNGGNI